MKFQFCAHKTSKPSLAPKLSNPLTHAPAQVGRDMRKLTVRIHIVPLLILAIHLRNQTPLHLRHTLLLPLQSHAQAAVHEQPRRCEVGTRGPAEDGLAACVALDELAVRRGHGERRGEWVGIVLRQELLCARGGLRGC
jgi:hypothetical protein